MQVIQLDCNFAFKKTASYFVYFRKFFITNLLNIIHFRFQIKTTLSFKVKQFRGNTILLSIFNFVYSSTAVLGSALVAYLIVRAVSMLKNYLTRQHASMGVNFVAQLIRLLARDF